MKEKSQKIAELEKENARLRAQIKMLESKGAYKRTSGEGSVVRRTAEEKKSW